MTYYVIIHEWSREYDHDTEILGVKLNKEDATAVFSRKKKELKNDAKKDGWRVYDDNDMFYEAAYTDDPDRGHDILRIQIVTE